jgi:hypothetical protein
MILTGIKNKELLNRILMKMRERKKSLIQKVLTLDK